MIVKFNTVDNVKKFVNIANQCKGKVDVKSDRYLVDGKSIMGVFSLDFSHELEVITENDDDLNLIKSIM